MRLTSDKRGEEDPGKIKDVVSLQELENLLQRQMVVNDILRETGAPVEQLDEYTKTLATTLACLREVANTPEARDIEAAVSASLKGFKDRLVQWERVIASAWFKGLWQMQRDNKQLLDGINISFREFEDERRRIELEEKMSISWRDFASTYNATTGRHKQSYLEKFVKARRLEAVKNERHNRQLETKQSETPSYYGPTSQALTLINSMAIYPKKLPVLKGRTEARDRRVKMEVKDKGITYVKQRSAEDITIIGIMMDKLDELADEKRGGGKGVAKVFNYAMIKINEQAYRKEHGKPGEIIRDTVSFPLRDLVDMGQYSDTKSAKQAMGRILTLLSGIRVSVLERTAKSTRGTLDISPLFINTSLTKDGRCILTLNVDLIPWDLLFEYFTIIPNYYFSLSARAANLLYRIFVQARQETAAIRKTGKFSVAMKTLQTWMGLPALRSTRNPSRDLPGRIEAAITEIEDAEKASNNNESQLLLTPKYSGESAKDYMDGTVEIELRGEYKDYFSAQAQQREKKINAARKRWERIEDAAKAKALANKKEAETDA